MAAIRRSAHRGQALASDETTDDAAPWDPELFLRFEVERARPARDLIGHLSGDPRRSLDLGCGVGASTGFLAERFPRAKIVGVDYSRLMLAEARRRQPNLTFERLEIDAWRPREAADLILSDSALHWIADHLNLFPKLMGYLAPGGSLAVEMPDNHQEPSHVLMRLIAADGPWADRLVPIAKTRPVISSHADYYNWLRPLSATLEIWRTTYIHPLAGIDAIVDWFRGTALLPYLALLTPDEREDFLYRYRSELSKSYPIEPDGRVLFLLPRLFIVAGKAR